MLSAVTTENADRRYLPSIYNCSIRSLLINESFCD
jgi:hypothetical protein